MDNFLATYGQYLWLAGSLLVAVLIDYAGCRLVLETVRPASVYAFWAGRAGKLAALSAWLVFFNRFWYPQFLGKGEAPGDVYKFAEVVVVVAFLVFAIISMPKAALKRMNLNG